MLQNLYMYTGAFIREWRAGRNHLYLLDQETINLWRINTTKGSGVVKSEEVTQDIRAKGKRLVGGVLSWLSGLIRVWLQQKGKISALGRKWGAFPTFTASLLPSIRHNFYVKEAYLGVTQPGVCFFIKYLVTVALLCMYYLTWYYTHTHTQTQNNIIQLFFLNPMLSSGETLYKIKRTPGKKIDLWIFLYSYKNVHIVKQYQYKTAATQKWRLPGLHLPKRTNL